MTEAIAFDDYSHDMRELADMSAGIVTALRKRVEQAELLFALAVKSAGGTIEIDRYSILSAQKLTLTEHYNLANDSNIYVVT